MNNTSSYATVSNTPIACTFCGAHVQGKVTPVYNSQTKNTENVCKWVCTRCNNLVRQGKTS